MPFSVFVASEGHCLFLSDEVVFIVRDEELSCKTTAGVNDAIVYGLLAETKSHDADVTAALLANEPCRTVKEKEKVDAVVTTLAEDILKFVEEMSCVHAAILEIPATAVQLGVAKDSSS